MAEIQNVMLECIESLISHFRPMFVSKDLLPFLTSMPTANIEVVLNVAGILRKVLCSCKFHVPSSLIATKLLPPLIPLLISKKLGLNEKQLTSLPPPPHPTFIASIN
ncbi:hypothetical protein ACTXT7_013504 [Hymenolepis weldensis]